MESIHPSYSAITLSNLYTHPIVQSPCRICTPILQCHHPIKFVHSSYSAITLSNVYTQTDGYIKKIQYCGVRIYYLYKHSGPNLRFYLSFITSYKLPGTVILKSLMDLYSLMFLIIDNFQCNFLH